MKIVLLDASTLGEVKSIESLQNLGEFHSYSTTSPLDVESRIDGASIVITNKVVLDKSIIYNCKSLKLICVAATGMNNIDLKAAEERGILVKNVSGYSTDSVAQQTFAMLLSLTNHVKYYSDYVQHGGYSKSKIFTLVDNPIFELNGKTMGIIGLGTIGRKVATIATTFGMKVIYFSASGIDRKEEYEAVNFENLLKQSDVISIHSPLTEKTKNLIDSSVFKLMKPSAILINAGRGGIVNEDDLVEALNQNLLSTAALDVFENEPLSIDSKLLKVGNHEKLLMFPHIAWASVEARERLVQGIIKNIEDFLMKQ